MMSKMSRLERPLPKEEGTVLQQQSKDQTPGLLEMLKRRRWLALYQIRSGLSVSPKKGGHQEDYHKVFDGKNFVNWWKTQLLPNLHQPTIIMLDNAKYHLVYEEHVPKPGRMKKQEVIDWLQSNDIPHSATDTAPILRQKVKDWIAANEKIAVERLAEEQGHKVLFTPPYHSDLQPIELVWALVKGNVGQQYSVGTTLEEVYDRLMLEFGKLEESGHVSIVKMIEKCATTALQMWEEKKDDDNLVEDDSDGSDGNNSDATINRLINEDNEGLIIGETVAETSEKEDETNIPTQI